MRVADTLFRRNVLDTVFLISVKLNTDKLEEDKSWPTQGETGSERQGTYQRGDSEVGGVS